MTIPSYRADIDMPGHQIYIKFRDQEQPSLFVSAPKAAVNVKNFGIASEILRRSQRDELSVNLADWLDGLAVAFSWDSDAGPSKPTP